ncbi:MAG: hypothetical protein ACYCT7_08300 [bacterium]
MSTFYSLINWISQNSILPIALAIVAAVIGGIITGVFMIWQNKDNFKNSLKLNELEEKKLEKAVLQALETEIKVDWQRYEEFIKPSIEKFLEDADNKKFENGKLYQDDLNYFYMLLSYRISMSQDYFSIYNGNSSFIGKIKNKELRNEIVYVYTNIKGFLEIISLIDKNQDKIEKLLKMDLDFASELLKKQNLEGSNQVRMNAYKSRLNELIYQIKLIKTHQDNLGSQIEKLENLFKEEIENINKEINANK